MQKRLTYKNEIISQTIVKLTRLTAQVKKKDIVSNLNVHLFIIQR